MIYFVYPFMLIPAFLSVVLSGLWIRKITKEGIPDKEVETFFTGRKRQLLIDSTAALIFGVLVIGIILDVIYNPHANVLYVMIPPVLGITIGTILRYMIRLKGRNKDDGIIFVIVGFLILFLVLGGLHFYRSHQIEQRIAERSSSQNIIQEIPEGIDSYSINNIRFPWEEAELIRRTFPVIGQSLAIPKYYTQQETWKGEEETWRVTVSTYETRNSRIAGIISEGYLDFELGGVIPYLGGSWTERTDVADSWDVDKVYMTEDYPAILIQKEERVWIMEGIDSDRLGDI
jgi:hypothetical protein